MFTSNYFNGKYCLNFYNVSITESKQTLPSETTLVNCNWIAILKRGIFILIRWLIKTACYILKVKKKVSSLVGLLQY